MLKQYDNIIIR